MVMDLNALVVGDTPLYLLLAQGINDRGEIVGTALDSTGQQVGFLAVPTYGDEDRPDASKESREDSSRNVLVPSNVRPQLTGFSRLVLNSMERK